MSFYPIDKKILEEAKETVKTAPLTYSNPVEIISKEEVPRKSTKPRLPSDVVEYLNRIASSSVTIFTPFANGGVSFSDQEKQTYRLDGSFSTSGSSYFEDFTVSLRKMYAAITMILSRQHMISLSMNDVPMSYYYSNLYSTEKHAKNLSSNIYRRLYITDCVEYNGARERFRVVSGLKACYCAIVTLNTGIGEEDSLFSTTTRLVIADYGSGEKIRKGHIDSLIKVAIYPAIKNALEKVFKKSMEGAFDTVDRLEEANIMDDGLMSIRMALDDTGGSGAGNELTKENTGNYLRVVQVDPIGRNRNNIVVPLVAMMMASHVSDEYLDDIVSSKAETWVDSVLGENDENAWYSLMTSMLLRGLSPFYEYFTDAKNTSLEPAPISFDEREHIANILKI